ncbi:alkaline phosphatase family protein [Limnobacter sp.]|uniref:alkaline phosphatase family protein n=1 Tax=Limnobacter sp. TaxID=2003368 RepID=UPI00258A53E8|nr:alkaline phosphatase family protein [Limnobacter sp.]
MVSRRRFLGSLSTAAGSAMLASCGADSNVLGSNTAASSSSVSASQAESAGNGMGIAAKDMNLPALPHPDESGIEHIVLVMMENRSFDHYLGWVPGAEGRQAGLNFPDRKGRPVGSFYLADAPGYGYQSCGKEDPDHSYAGGRKHFNNGQMNGFLETIGDAGVDDDHFPVGYFQEKDLPFFSGVVKNYTVCDQYHHGLLASTYPNRIYMHAGQTDRVDNAMTTSTLTTIWDLLQAKGLTGTYYFQDLPLTALWGQKYLNISQPYEKFLLDAKLGTLPSVSFVDPRFLGENPQGVSNDDHPQADIRNGQAFLNGVYEALRTSPLWSKTLLVINYDEWGGFYDHVVPPYAPVTAQEAKIPNDGLLGFRVPCAIIGPRARRNHVSHFRFDPNSILNMISWRFGLPSLGARGDWSVNLAHALDFSTAPNLDAPAFNVPAGPFGGECQSGLPNPIQNIGADPVSSLANTILSGSTTPGVGTAGYSSMSLTNLAHNLEWLQLKSKAQALGFFQP